MALNMNPVDITSNDLPVKDVQSRSRFGIKERQIVSALARKDLEDKYLTLQEDYTELKKLSRNQDEKMKQMATKLVRLFNDKKKLDGMDKGPGKDLKTVTHIEDLEAEIRNLKVANEQLKNKLSVAKQQLQTHGKRQSPYDNIKPRVSTGIAGNRSATQQQRIKEQIRVGAIEQKSSARAPAPLLPQPRYGHSLLEESRIEKRELEELVASLEEQIKLLEEDRESLRQQNRVKQMDYEELELKLQSEISELKKASLRESSEMIRLEREVKDKCTKLEVMQGKFTNLEQIFEKVKASNEKALGEMENINLKLKEEQAKNSSLRHEMREKDFARTSLTEKDELIADLKNENVLLRETQEKLLHSTFDSERERRFRTKEREYQIKITQLEALTKADVLEKNELLDKLSLKEDESEKIHEELKELRVKFYSQKELYDDLAEKFKFFSKESNVDMDDIHEAVLLVKSRKEKTNQELSFLEHVEEESNQDFRKQLLQLQTQHAETINELEKARGMLQMQHNINKDYQKEVSLSTQKLDDLKRDYDTKMQEYAQMLDFRAERIKKLESQIKDIAYGTKQYKIDTDTIADSEIEESLVTHELERGQNVLEIHIGKVTITKEGLNKFANSEPQTFVTIEFFEYEMQATPVMTGQRPSFNFTSQFIVVVDDFFLHFIAKENALIEIHQAVGTDYKTLASGKLRMNDLLDKSREPIRGVLHLYDEMEEFAMLEYSIRLRVPMEQALRLYRERSKALGYITVNSQGGTSAVHEKPSSNINGMNELKITILRCDKLKSSSGQPSAYALYKFFDFADHDTTIIPNSTHPEFNDQHIFPITMNEELHNYLKSSVLNIYVFDDKENDPTSVIGIAKVPLVSLSHNKSIRGTFQLFSNTQDSSNGSVEVILQWLFTYNINESKFSRQAKKIEKASLPSASSFKEIMKPLDSENYTDNNTINDILTSERKTPVAVDEEPLNEHLKTVSFKEDTIIKTGSVVDEVFDEKPIENEMKHVDDAVENSGVVDDLADESGNNDEKSDSSLVEEELRRTVEAMEHRVSPVLKNEIGEDTLFEEPVSDLSDDEDEVVVAPSTPKIMSPSHAEEVPNEFDSVTTSDSEGVIVSSAGAKAISSMSSSSAVVSIEVASLTLYENASLYKLEKPVQLYVAYRFLDEDPATLETPDSLPLPSPNRPIHYNFKKIFHVDKENNEERHQSLMRMLLPDHSSEGRLFFNVVAEDGEECEDSGIADVSFLQMLQDDRDLFEEDIEVVDFDGELIGSLTVSVEALDALKSLYE